MKDIRRESVVLKAQKNGVGIELGVAEGIFSERVLELNHLSFLYGVDMYAGDRGHDINQYSYVLKKLDRFRERYSLIKMKFDEALDLFPDEFFDFIYVDGYAHTGEEDGKTIHDWYPKLKKGGVMAGDDYHSDWPLVVNAVDDFVRKYNLNLNIINCSEQIPYCQYPTWFIYK